MSSPAEQGPAEHSAPDPSPTAPDSKLTPSDVLPDVQPPTAGFIMKLFIIPGVIVFVMVMVWLAFTWLAHMGSADPHASLQAMKQNRPNSWQQAWNLVESLQQNEKYREDAALAKKVADYLDELRQEPLPPRQANSGSTQRDARSEEIARRGFLCKALGEFLVVDDSLPVLVAVAANHADEDELRVRLAALESIALLAENLRDTQPLDDPALMSMLLSASRDADHKIALRSALALAALGTDEALDRLEEIVAEPQHVDVHYNAAVGLARHGNAASMDILLEMLDPQESRGVEDEADERARDYKRAVIMINGLRAVRMLAEENQNADLQQLAEPVKQLAAAGVNPQVRDEAARTLRVLQRRAT